MQKRSLIMINLANPFPLSLLHKKLNFTHLQKVFTHINHILSNYKTRVAQKLQRNLIKKPTSFREN